MNTHLNNLKFCDEAARLTDLWLSLPRGKGTFCPSKADFSPMSMRKYLSSVILYERIAGGEIIVRVAGTNLENFLGRDITGHNIFDIFPPEFTRAYHRYYLNLSEYPCAGIVERPIHGAGGIAYFLKTLQLPMLNSAGEVTHFVGVGKTYPLPKHFTDYRGAAMTASRNLNISYADIGAGVPDHLETTMARGVSA